MADTTSEGLIIPSPGDNIPGTGNEPTRLLGSTANTAIAKARFTRGRILSPVDIFTLDPGVYTVSSLMYAEMVTNIPEVQPCTIVVEGNLGQSVKAIRVAPYDREYTYETVSAAAGSGGFKWRKNGSSGDGSFLGSGVTNSLLVQDFSRRRGGVWSTGGKAAVSIRLDHGLANVRDKLLPILQSAGMVPSLALNSRNWDRTENGTVTASVVNGWVTAGDVEIWNHSATHTNPTSEAGVIDEVVTGLAELRAQLPAAQIDGWAIPGVGTDPYLGMGSLTSVKQIYESYAGRLILEHHAVTTGHIEGTAQRVLDGTVRQAQLHFGLDTKTVAEATVMVDAAIAGGTGLQLMLHPSVVDSAGSISTASFQAVMGYIVARRDAGELVVCSPYEMALADSTSGGAGLDADSALAAFEAGLTA